jgi:hypothetical protein
MSMPDYADIWETTDTVVMERPRRKDDEPPEPQDGQRPEAEVVFLT